MSADIHEEALNRLVARAFVTGIQSGVLAAQALLAVRGEQSAADALLVHYDSIIARANSVYEAQAAIDKARESA